MVDGQPKPNGTKPGFKTTEFWLTAVAQIAGLAASSGAIAEGSQVERILGLVLMALATLGYQASRGAVKKAAATTKQPPAA